MNYIIECMMVIGLGAFGWAAVVLSIYGAVKVGESIPAVFMRVIKLLNPKGGR